ncbi:MAG TPA: helix-turn-helix transcriptional regulator [Chloroflexota bacterium]|jgi:transcriptional regulator with XRE-family HTH domain|nr:helix-turn-helix transcriptional regulator [Chloroflexota bacterium]
MSSYPGTEATTRAELSDFLKSRRARIAPAAVGLRGGSRRRTPGLRREEVADLAGVGLTWYTWLEQGRGIRVSPEVLTGIARALQLEPAERAHLFRLAGHAPPATEAAASAVSPRLRRILDRWDPLPAHVAGRRRDVLAWNRAGEALNGWSRLPDGRRNVLWWVFMVPTARRVLVDWEQEAALAVAAFRAEAGGALGEPDYRELVAELLEGSPDFAAVWARQDVRGRQEALHRFAHPELGRFDLEFMPFQVAEQPSLRLYLYTPADDGRSENVLRQVVAAATAATP